jgi:hypothetical protein
MKYINSSILVTLMMQALGSSETSVLKIATRRNIPEDGILHSHRSEELKSYMALTDWDLKRRRNVSSVKYELFFCILEDDIIHCYCHENLRSYVMCYCSNGFGYSRCIFSVQQMMCPYCHTQSSSPSHVYPSLNTDFIKIFKFLKLSFYLCFFTAVSILSHTILCSFLCRHL